MIKVETKIYGTFDIEFDLEFEIPDKTDRDSILDLIDEAVKVRIASMTKDCISHEIVNTDIGKIYLSGIGYTQEDAEDDRRHEIKLERMSK